MRNRFGVLLLALTAALGTQSAFADQLVTNGGFETGDFGDWTVSGPITFSSNSSLFYGVDAQDAYAGNYGAYLSTLPSQAPLTLSQTVSGIMPSHSYSLDFDLANLGAAQPGFPNSFAISLGSTTLFTLTDAAAIPYQQFTLDFTTAGNAASIETLSIASTNTAAYFSLDNVSVSSAPEPSAFLLVVPALGLLMMMRRRKTA